MAGRHKWSDLKEQMTPQQRQRMAEKTAETRSTMPPSTYAQVRWAASVYDAGEHHYNKYYRAVYEPSYPHTLMQPRYLSADQVPDIEPLRRFLNQWKCRLPSASGRPIADAMTELGSYREGLFDSAIEAKILDDSVFDATESIFDRLTSIQHVGPTTASKILGMMYPRFFVMWDTAIREAYFDRSNARGHEFAIFMKEMRNSAIFIVADAQNHGTKDPSGTISKEIGQSPPFTLAKFINDYIWLTVTKKERFFPAAAQEHYA